jgi:hypothetical protein
MPTKQELLQKRAELLKDIEALDRVIRLFEGDSGIPEQKTAELRPAVLIPTTPPGYVPSGLKPLIVMGLESLGENGATPKTLLEYCKGAGYAFTNDGNGTASITTALARLVHDRKVRKEDGGKYFWLGNISG